MRLLSVKNALLVSALLGYLPQFAFGAPVAQTAGLQVVRRGDDISTQHWQIETTNINTRDEDEDLDDLETRAFRPPRPIDPPPPPPAPRPRPNPGAPGGSGTGPRPRPPPRPVTPPRPEPPQPKPDWAPIADNVNPGQGPGVGADPKPMGTYEQGGKDAVTNYQATVKNGKEDTKILDPATDDLSLLGKNPAEAFLDIRKNDQYQIVDTDVLISDVKELKNFQSGELGFDIKSSGLLRQTVVNTADGRQMINRGTYDKGGQFIAYQDAFKDADTAAADKKIPLNEIGLQNFKAAAGVNTNKLKAAFLMDIQNKEFWGIIRNNYNDLKQPFDQVLTFKSGTPQFDRIMGSPNFKSKFFAFGNHHNDIGDPVPDKVIVIPKDAPDSGNKLTVAVVFKDADAA